jgi:adenine phosphoribosyltransferase
MAAMMPGVEPIRQQFLDLQTHIRSIPDFPKPGILFRDINPLLRNPAAMDELIRRLGGICDAVQPDLIVGIESRGFIVGTPLALKRSLGFVPVRKPGKLPGTVIGVDYALEYGSDRLEIQSDALSGNPRVLVVDDLLATGGTAAAAGALVREAGGQLVGFAFVIELETLAGRSALPGDVPAASLIRYA